MMDEQQKTAIALLYKQEMLLARLYRIFARTFPEYEDFWVSLAREEELHADWIKQLYQAEKKDIVAFEGKKVRSTALNTYLEHLDQAIKKAEQKGFELRTAIAYTLDFERSLIERNVFSHFEGLDDRSRKVMKTLQTETRKHVKKIEEMAKTV